MLQRKLYPAAHSLPHSGVLHQPAAQPIELLLDRHQLVERAAGSMEYPVLNLARLQPQLTAGTAQVHDHLALVLVGTAAADETERLDTLEQRRQRGGVQVQALPDLRHGDAVALP